ncbi:Uu.00g123410.m01.CDS01 [Anthostomella pinea]|uniref:Uu.00g123410.m01.CDS01 n=1 Tax=Anthostomella pinea TaxID=933095 RepID=A0AAI8VHE8_9PEZI|nr:Uu.00g123410.m01.CDS01 [Anthostomella pinea]
MDKGNISNALTSTFTEDLGIAKNDVNDGNQLQLAAISRHRDLRNPFQLVALAPGVGSLVAAGGFTFAGFRGLASWQWLFIVDGLFTLIVAMIFVLLLPRDTEHTKSLCGIDVPEALSRYHRYRRCGSGKATLPAAPEAEDLRTALVHHTDFGTITLLANVVGGLQILSPEKSQSDESGWLWARPEPGCLIVNIGDAMVQWTGGLLRSSMHRVRHAPGAQRFVNKYSVVYLALPERNAIMRRLVGKGIAGDDGEDGNLTAWEWEVKKAVAMKRLGSDPWEKGCKE